MFTTVLMVMISIIVTGWMGFVIAIETGGTKTDSRE